jgi:formate/nitrite transporter
MTNPSTEGPSTGIGSVLPAEIARQAEQLGAAKVRQPGSMTFMLAVLGGAFIGLGAMFATTVLAGSAGALPFGVARLLAGLVFCLGLILVVAGGAELFTGNALMVMAWAAGHIRLRELLRVWVIVYAGNLVGAVGTALLVCLSGQPGGGDGAVAEVAVRLALAKSTMPFAQALFLGILCNVLVCLAVWLAIGARSLTDKVLAVLFPVSAFVAAGFEHSVANMYLIPLGLLLKAGLPDPLHPLTGGMSLELSGLTWPAFAASLVPVTIGNIIGGGVLVGGVYWFIYLRHRRA